MGYTLFYALVFSGFLAALFLKFFAHGWLRGNLYDVWLMAFLSSATFSCANFGVLKSIADGADVETLRQSQIALNRKIAAAWALVACGAELIQGIVTMATGKPALGTFDPIDLACYVAGAVLSFNVNSLLYVDKRNR